MKTPLQLLRSGWDTESIRQLLGITEAEAYNTIHRERVDELAARVAENHRRNMLEYMRSRRERESNEPRPRKFLVPYAGMERA